MHSVSCALCRAGALQAAGPLCLALSSRSGSHAGLAQCTEYAGSFLGREWLCRGKKEKKKATDMDWLPSWELSQDDGGQVDGDGRGGEELLVGQLSADCSVNRRENKLINKHVKGFPNADQIEN